mgnify:CR=1 FL=1
MILFVFEGNEREPRLYRTLERLYFPRENDNIICSFGNNIYDLYNELLAYGEGGDIVSLMRERLADAGDATLNGIRSSEISEIFLFFDYDFQNSQLSLEEINRRVREMLTWFDDETGNGKLYINYPMIESIRYTRELPDADYITKEKYIKVKDNWSYLKQMNVAKAHWLITGENSMPVNKSMVNQLSIFDGQVAHFVTPKSTVAILNSFPIFIYEYMK